MQRRSEEPLSDPQYTGELKFLTVGRASEEKGYDIAVQITAELKNGDFASNGSLSVMEEI